MLSLGIYFPALLCKRVYRSCFEILGVIDSNLLKNVSHFPMCNYIARYLQVRSLILMSTVSLSGGVSQEIWYIRPSRVTWFYAVGKSGKRVLFT